MVERYSILPCPSGCFLSGVFPASLVPIMVTIEERASLKLFTASSITEIEFATIPATALNEDYTMFQPTTFWNSKKIIKNNTSTKIAGDGNRTRISSLGSWCSATELHLHIPACLVNLIIAQNYKARKILYLHFNHYFVTTKAVGMFHEPFL